MPKKRRSLLTASSARRIARKLGAKVSPGRRHDQAIVRIDGVYVGRYGIRRGTRAGHDYIPRQIHVSMREALGLERCPVSKEDYKNILKRKGELPIDGNADVADAP